MKIKTPHLLVYVFLFLLTALVLDLANPFFDKPSRDGGFFLYAGQQILGGKIPYTEVWDNKGPAIFYINALGLWLGGGSRWGVWMIEFIFIFGSLLILYRILLNRWGMGSALFGVTMAGLGLRIVLGYGNYTEEYALFFNAIGLMLFFSIVDSKNNLIKYFWIGALFGLSFSFRANNIGALFAILASVFLFYVFKRSFVKATQIIGVTLLGFAVPLLLWTLYFALLGAAEEMIYGSITFNFSYSAAKDRTWLDLFGGLLRGGMGWYGRVALLGWLVLSTCFVFTFIRRKDFEIFNIFLLVWFPVEVLLSNLSGRSFNHYYISWTLAIAVYCAMLFLEIFNVLNKIVIHKKWSEQISVFIPFVLILILLSSSTPIISRYTETIDQAFDNPNSLEYMDPISIYILENTDSEDLVLTWYPERGINFTSNRTSPVKYTNYPLFIDDSLTEEIESTYIQNLIENRPELIIDCAREVDAIPSLDPATKKVQFGIPGLRRKMYIHEGMEIIFDFVKANYHIETKIDHCIIFRINQ